MDSNNAASVNVQIRIPKELKSRLARIAIKRGMKVGDAHRLALVEYCERAEKQHPQNELNL